MKILFLGGNGNISWHCTNEAVKSNHEVWVLNREVTLQSRRAFPAEVKKLKGDIRNQLQIKELLKDMEFDVVCDFLCNNEEHAASVIDLFKEKTGQYIAISSEVVYKRESKYLPFKEDCPRNNPETSDEYIAGKIKAEDVFFKAFNESNFPVTVVRPAYTYDTIIPVSVGHNCFTASQRFIDGKPVLIAGDGTGLRPYTHSSDFASAFVKLIGNKSAIGNDFHIASDEWLTWNEVTAILLDSLGVKNARYIHIPLEDVLNSKLAEGQKDLLFQKMWHNICDTTKIKRLIPEWKAKVSFSQGIEQTIKWIYDNDSHRRIDTILDGVLEEMTIKYGGY
jgi:nucleoside-diphosphate-sugar epimerase